MMMMMLIGDGIRFSKRGIVGFVATCIFLLAAAHSAESKCSRTCVAENCDSLMIRYGKFCGAGWSGCHGETPCDDLDACCKSHDECVGKHGYTAIVCHDVFKRCIRRVRKSGRDGFSRACPVESVVPIMILGMDMGILVSRWVGS